MKNINYILIVLIFASSSCKVQYSNEVELRIEHEASDSCGSLCYIQKLYMKNKTEDSLYLVQCYIPTTNRVGILLPPNKLAITSLYDRPALIKKDTNYNKCICKNMLTDPPNKFREEYRQIEIDKKIKESDIETIDSAQKKTTEELADLRYSFTHFLEPKEECMTAIWQFKPAKHNKTLKIRAWIDFSQKRNQLLSKRKDYNGIKHYYKLYDYPEKIAGYKLFFGKTKSNTIILKNGELIKNKPPNKGRLWKMNWFNDLVLRARHKRR